MAITYKKALKTAVFTLHDGSTVTAADTATDPKGSMALGMYDAKVVKVVVTTAQSEDITKADPYCAE